MPFDGNVREFLFAFQISKIVPNESCSSNFLLKNSSTVNTFFLANPSALLSSAKRMYSSLNVNIAEGSIPIKGVSLR
jgi:hypothetical protein